MALTLLLSIANAIGFGVSDFFGGLASRSERAIRVAAFSHIAGLVVIVPIAFFYPFTSVATADLLWGAGAGITSAMGIFALYAALGSGRMGVIAPITASLSASLPVLYGFAIGETLATVNAVGLATVFVAIVLVSVRGSRDDIAAVPLSALGFAVCAGVAFSASFILLSRTHVAAGLWPVIPLRLVSVALLAGGARLTTGRISPARTLFPMVLSAGVVEVIATVFVLLAVQRGPIAVASVIGSLYPVMTMLLARIVLDERLVRHQIVGVAVAFLGIVLVSL